MAKWILGAPDPEMACIEELLQAYGETVVYATHEDGSRVTPGTAYCCAVPEVGALAVFAVECIDHIPEHWVRIDHHRPGDAGFGQPPAEFLPASSIGQVIAVLARTGALPTSWPALPVNSLKPGYIQFHEGQWVVGSVAATHAIPERFVLAAAADHCLAAAYRGECPGVEPDTLMKWRAEVRAKHQGRDVEEVLLDIVFAQETLAFILTLGAQAEECVDFALGECHAGHKLSKYRCDLCGRTWISCMPGEHPSPVCELYYAADLRGLPHVPELPEAAVRGGFYYVAEVVERDGRRKVVFGGATTPERVRAFMKWAEAQGYTDIYGDPERGYAGAYVKESGVSAMS